MNNNTNTTTKTEKKKEEPKLRKWFFTIWKMDINWSELYEDYEDIIRYLIVQKEKGEKTGRLHWQGCIHFKNPKKMTWLRRFLNLGKGANSGDLRPQRGSNAQVKAYCHKIKTSQGFQMEFGTPSKQGFRSDMEDIHKRIRSGEKDFSICDDHIGTYSRYFKWFEKYRGLHLESLSHKYRHLNVKFLSGPTRCGKTRMAYDNHDSKDIFKINCGDGLKWFDGYTGQKVLILDEFKNNISLSRILDLLDGHQCRLEYKGGFTYALWDTVYITTNLTKDEIYPNQRQHHMDALWARINQFVNLYPKDSAVPKGNEVTEGNTRASVQIEKPLKIESAKDSRNSKNLTRFLDSKEMIFSDDEDDEKFDEEYDYSNNYLEKNCSVKMPFLNKFVSNQNGYRDRGGDST